MARALILLGILIVAAGLWLYTPDLSRAVLGARYATAADRTDTVAGVALRVRDTGPRDAPVVILLHGFGSSLDTWEPWARRLSVGFRVIRFDLPGFGLTGRDPTGDYSDGRAVVVLAALMDQLGVARADLIGNSLGGKIAWQFAAAHPDRVGRLVLISPDGFASPGLPYDKTPRLPLAMRLLPYVFPKPLVRLSLRPAYGDPRRLTDAIVSRYRDLMLAPGVRRAILARSAQVMPRDPVPILRTIRAPTLLLWGDRDRMIPPGNAADYLRALPQARLVTLPGLGHVPFEEDPETALVPVLAFLTAAPASGP